AIRKFGEEVEAFTKPTSADSAAVRGACAQSGMPPEHQQYAAMEEQIASLRKRVDVATDEVARLAERTSGLTRRQLGIACERINLYQNQLAAKKGMNGFSSTELEALEQRKSDLERLCT